MEFSLLLLRCSVLLIGPFIYYKKETENTKFAL